MGKTVLFEAGAALIFFGSLIHQPELAEIGAQALQELRLRGYEIPTAADPVRVYPTTTAGDFSSSHAGGWRTGVISLRKHPQGSAGPGVILRHELMHEASLRTCKGNLPLWVEEAAAISFSGELAGALCVNQSNDHTLEKLRRRVQVGARLDQEDYRTLATMVTCFGWPSKPCARSEPIEKLLQHPPSRSETDFSYVLMSLISGRILESHGDLKVRCAPGSLLKIPYAAALREASPEGLGKELAASDTEKLLARKNSLDLERFRFLISPVKETELAQNLRAEELATKDERFWRQYLGERDFDGSFPLEANLVELAWMLRASLLYRPTYFTGLAQNGFLEASTLYRAPQEDKKILAALQAMAKTGTVTDERSTPLLGHFMVAWPAKEPAFLAVFRSSGVNGAAIIHRSAKILEAWARRYPPQFGKVRVRLLSRAPRSSWEVFDECPSFVRSNIGDSQDRVSTCGRFRIVSAAYGSRSERLVAGILFSSRDGQTVVLETDPETYADAVLASEAQELQGEARKALRAVIVWNGTHGRTRHEDSSSLCDTTHCMVFQGSPPGAAEAQGSQSDPTLLRLLDGLAAGRKLEWLPFSQGGSERWVKEMPVSELFNAVNELSVLDLRRQRTRSGNVVVHLIYPESDEIVPCEIFRHRLKLPSCPDVIHHDENQKIWVFSGIGKGHGEGLSIVKAGVLAEAGHSASAILTDAYQ